MSDPVLQLVCLDAGIGMRPIFDKFRTVIITSGTLSPIELYPKLLSFAPKCSESLTMTLSRQCIRPTIVTKARSRARTHWVHTNARNPNHALFT